MIKYKGVNIKELNNGILTIYSTDLPLRTPGRELTVVGLNMEQVVTDIDLRLKEMGVSEYSRGGDKMA